MTQTVQERLAALSEPFPSKDIEWRIGRMNQAKDKGYALPYLKFHSVADRLDSVMGAENWKNEYKAGPAGGVICQLSLRIDGEWVAKENGADNSDMEAVKGGLSDALKRAAVLWGVGRYLYSYQAGIVPLDEHRRMTFIPRLPDEFLPEAERGQSDETTQSQQRLQATLTMGDSSVGEQSAKEPEYASEAQQPDVSNQAAVEPEAAPAATPVAAEEPQEPVQAENPAEQPAAEEPAAATAVAQSAAPSEDGELDPNGPLPDGWVEADKARVEDILNRARKNVSINALTNYVKTKGAGVMSEAACSYLLTRLATFSS